MIKGKKKTKQENVKNKKGSTAGALYASDTIPEKDLRPYKESLDRALADERITNVAVTAPYGIGKSSVLESYFKQRKKEYRWHVRGFNVALRAMNWAKKKYFFSPKLFKERVDFEFVNLPKFFPKDSQEKDIQKKIVEQLLFSSNPKRFPFSKIKRIKDSSVLRDTISVLITLGLVSGGIYFYGVLSNKPLINWNVIMQFGYYQKWLLIVLSCSILWFSLHVYRKIKIKVSKSTINGKGRIGPFELSSNEDGTNELSQNIFNTFSEELMYFFRKSRKKIIIFEDLDRFEKPSIFQELRELNLNVNKRQPKIVFVYSLQDKVFIEGIEKEEVAVGEEPEQEGNTSNGSDKGVPASALQVSGEEAISNDENVRLKAKFFDYVIPVYPITSYYNTMATIKAEMKQYNKKHELDDSFLKQMGFYLKDVRLIILIVSEFFMYLNVSTNSNSKNSDHRKLFSLIAYKNFFPDDYEKLSYGNSILNTVFDADISDYLYSKIIEEKTNKLEIEKIEKANEIKRIEESLEVTKNKLLKSSYFEMRQKYTRNNYNFRIDGTLFNEEEALDFYEKLYEVHLLINTVQVAQQANSYPSTNIEIKEFFTQDGEENIVFKLLKYEVDTVSGLVKQLKKELQEIEVQIKGQEDKYNEMNYGKIIQLISDSNMLNCTETDRSLVSVLNKIKNNSFMRYLFYNDLVDAAYYYYISPAGDDLDGIDSSFIYSVLEGREHEDTKVTDVEKVYKELDLIKGDFKYAYSSNLLWYMVKNDCTSEYTMIIDKFVKEKDRSFFENFLKSDDDKCSKERIIKDAMVYVLTTDFSFVKDNFVYLQKENKKMVAENIVTNIEHFDEQVGRDKMNEILSLCINDYDSFEVVTRDLSEDTRKQDRYCRDIYIRNLEEALDDAQKSEDIALIKVIFVYGLYEANPKNFQYLDNVYDVNMEFARFHEKIQKEEVEYIDKKRLFHYFADLYKEKQDKSYDYSELGNLVEYFTEQEFEAELLSIYSCINLKDVSHELNNNVLSKINFFELYKSEQINAEVVGGLITQKKLVYNLDFLKLLSERSPDDVFAYIYSINKLDSKIIPDNYVSFKSILSESDKLYFLNEIEDEAFVQEILESLDEDLTVWTSINHEKTIFDDNMISKLCGFASFKSLKWLFINAKINNYDEILDAMFKQSKIILQDLDDMLGVETIFSEMEPNGHKTSKIKRTHKSESTLGWMKDKGFATIKEAKEVNKIQFGLTTHSKKWIIFPHN
ncbi:hypothetical protein HCB25_03660 [Listeria booriae]|uniref:YobI-like P-loop NTPase domain-containing protein n=1 Tax=Listeria booriae TaxID=1552123 RepID=A0A842FH90_9LIST|nr:hypothetical protein [Listeria booriae]MBC2243151.1 hypothetical protein [Listeria booriae]